MGKKNSKTSSMRARKKEKKDIIELRQVLQTPSFTDEYNDIFYHVIHRYLQIMTIRHSLLNKWKDPYMGRNYFKYNRSIGTHTNKLAALVSGLTNLVVPKVFPCLEIIILYT